VTGCFAAAACQVNRDRPGPPRLTITIDQDSVGSPDTLTGTVRVEDVDGIDSVWLAVDSAPPIGEDGLLAPTFFAPFKAGVGGGHVFGQRIDVRLSSRDITGFTGVLDTSVAVRGP
jgi:hypothetical protein